MFHFNIGIKVMLRVEALCCTAALQTVYLAGSPRQEVEAVAAEGPQVVDEGEPRSDVTVAVERDVDAPVECLEIKC